MLRTVVNLVDAERTVHVEMSDALSDVALAAVSAEPRTLEEWRVAMTRFVDAAVAEAVLRNSRPGLGTPEPDGGEVIIDLTAQLLVVNTVVGEFPRIGNVRCCSATELMDRWLPYRIPDDWQIELDLPHWQAVAADRRERLELCPPVDFRRVLYGELAGWLVRQWLERAQNMKEPTLQLQEAWLMTERRDLQGHTPRQILLRRRALIDADVSDQGENWTISGRCPPALAAGSHAFRFGGFGSHEIILYHEMTTHLLLECDRRLRGRREVDECQEVRHLEQLQQEWLHQPHPALYDQSPAAIIARERSRLPAIVPQGQGLEHDDCPLCRMMFDSGQPMIWQLDSFALDSHFATSLYDSYAAWEEAQVAWGEETDEVEGEVERMLVDPDDAPAGGRVPDAAGVWERSHTNMQFFAEMPPLEACAVMMFSIGGHLAELMYDLEDERQELRRRLHEEFDALRVAFRHQEELWMMRSRAEGFADALHDVAACRPDLTAKCQDLNHKIQFLCDRYAEHLDPCSRTD